uniref:Uncharacterized protein n=1 Tax=Anguilla anguilla TaxID=7936 RepID=A0A0E9SPK3_ANGAN
MKWLTCSSKHGNSREVPTFFLITHLQNAEVAGIPFTTKSVNVLPL